MRFLSFLGRMLRDGIYPASVGLLSGHRRSSDQFSGDQYVGGRLSRHRSLGIFLRYSSAGRATSKLPYEKAKRIVQDGGNADDR